MSEQNDGADYYLQVNDDLLIAKPDSAVHEKGWSEDFVEALQNSSDIGVAGFNDPAWNCTMLTQAMVSRRHWEIFGYFYPQEIKDWYSDFWISRLYQQTNRMFCFAKHRAENDRTRVGTRYQKCIYPYWQRLIERDQRKVKDAANFK